MIWPANNQPRVGEPSMPQRSISFRATAIGTALVALPVSSLLAADVTLPPISVGAGVRSSFTQTNPDAGDDVSDFELNSARIYISGKVTENISLMFNTDRKSTRL